MIVGIPKETKDGERRVAVTPEGARRLAADAHTVRVETRAGEGVGFSDADYAAAGATIVANAAAAFDADLVVKVKELQPSEERHLRSGTALFSFLHLPAHPEMARELLARRITGIAFETVGDADGGLPLLAPMSALAGRPAVLEGARLLTLPAGGNGTLLADGAARVLVVGAGAAGGAAARLAAALGAQVTAMAASDRHLRALREAMPGIRTALCTAGRVAELAREADLVVGAVNVRGARTPKLLTRADVAAMRPGSVLVEVCIDGGGIAATSRQTTHADPTFVAEGVTHYCVGNMPAAVARSATLALAEAVLPRLLALARRGVPGALRDDAGLAEGLHVSNGAVNHAAIADALGLPCVPAEALLHACGQREAAR